MTCSYYGTNEGTLNGWPVTHMIMDEFFNSLVDKHEAKLLKKHTAILVDLKKTYVSEFKSIKKNLNIANFDIEQLKTLKDEMKALKEELEQMKKKNPSIIFEKESVNVEA